MKQSTKDTLNELIRRERNGEYGESIPDSVLDDMMEDVYNTLRKKGKWFYLYVVHALCLLGLAIYFTVR